MEMDNLEKSLKVSFVGAANQLAQLFTNSVSYQKQAYVHGYNKSNKDMLEFLMKYSQSGLKTISVDTLMEYLRTKLEDGSSSNEESFQKRNGNLNPTPVPTPQVPQEQVYPTQHVAPTMQNPQPSFSFTFTNNNNSNATSPSSFTFLPPDSNSPNVSVFGPYPTQTNYVHTPTDPRKRQIELFGTSMEYTSQDPYHKKSRLNTNS